MKVGVIGCGGMGTTHYLSLKVLSSQMDVEVVALADCREEFLQKAAAEFPEARTYTYGMELIERENLDAVHICLPSYLHTEHAVAAMKKGMNVLVEKPVCLTREEGELLLVEEYRVPLHARTVGLPAGISGDEGEESSLQSARRELEEETGYRADSWTYLLAGPSSPGLTTEMVSFYMAEGLHRISEGGGVAHENITVHRIPLTLVHDWLMEQMEQGKVVDPKIFMGLYFLSRSVNGMGLEE